jgi:hypothetical protein
MAKVCGRCRLSLGTPTPRAPVRCGCAWLGEPRVYVSPERVPPSEDASRRGGEASALRRAVRRLTADMDRRPLHVRALENRA